MDKTVKEKLSSLTIIQMRYVMARQQYPTKAEAARAVGVNPSTAYAWPNAVEETAKALALERMAMVESVLDKGALKAMFVLMDQLSSDDELVRLRAADQILNRAMGKPVPMDRLPKKEPEARPEIDTAAIIQKLQDARREGRLDVDD